MRKIILASALIISTLSVFAQEGIPTSSDKDSQTQVFFEKPKPEWREKLRYGGSAWLEFFGTFYIDFSPIVGYELNDKGTVVGIGANFIFLGTFSFSGSPNRNNMTKNNNTAFGPKVFIRQQVFKRFFAHAEYEFINAYADQFYSYNLNTNDPNKKVWGSSPLIGAGFYQGGDGRRGSFISLMYNLGYPNRGFVSPQSLPFLGSQSPITFRYGFLF